MNVMEINTEILQGGFTNEQLNSINDAVRFARARLADQTKRTLRIGSQVKFTSNRNGATYKGTLESIKIKNAIVATQMGRYKVPMNMLEAA
jgi:hypothetical protein